MKASRKFIEHTADILFQAEAPSLKELFEQCGLALEESQLELSNVSQKEEKLITGKHKDIDRLLFDFLDDLLFYKDSEQLIFSGFNVIITKKEGEYHLKCKALGEKINRKKHEEKVDVKAITMHLFEVKKIKDGWKAQVLIDI
ncbi:MAG: archease [Nanoarchaeota archaeon]|nr:archease [Nanoarchaeota archaeon]MBU1644177.1 archease [Nanoarchaeota archaeon]MBU1977518.1 archease [Nanoarchaeota archaeon]